MNTNHNFLIMGLGLFIFFAVPAFAQTSVTEIDNFLPHSDLFQSFLDTADQKKTSEQWLDYARFGLESAMSSWERDSLLLRDDTILSELRGNARAEFEEILKSRYADWLSKNFFNSVDPPSLGILSEEIAELNGIYLYETDGDGNVSYKTTIGYADIFSTDSEGNDALVQKGEKTLWVEGVKAVISGLLDAWDRKIVSAFSELKADITDSLLLEELQTDYLRDFETFRQQYRNQLYRLYNTEQSRYTELRLYDRQSLEYQYGKKTASSISGELIASTETELDNRLQVLLGGLKTQVETVESGSSPINADDWRESFSAMLQQGLNSWDKAEQQFFMERIEWEQNAAGEVAGSEEVWADAFVRLSEKRSEWMNNYREALQDGVKLWTEENLELEDAVAKAVAEIDMNTASAESSLQSRIDNLVGMLLQSVNMMQTARSSWEFWMDRFDGGEKNSFDTSDAGYDYMSMADAMSSVKPGLSQDQRNADKTYTEAVYWAQLFRTYQDYAENTQQRLAETYGIVVFDDTSMLTAFSGTGLSDALLDNEILSEPDAWESIYLDEYQVALLKARAYMQYWQKQKLIAAAVYDYASDNSSTKENADETLKRLSESKSAYEAVLFDYSESLERLSNISTALEAMQTSMKTIQEEISGYQLQLAEKQANYHKMFADIDGGSGEFLAGQFREYYLQLLESMGMTGNSGQTPSDALEEYLLAAAEYGLEEQISLISDRVADLLSGGSLNNLDEAFFNPETSSLSELRRRMLTTSGAGFTSGSSSDGIFGMEGNEEAIEQFSAYLSDKLFLEMNDYRYDMLTGLFSDYGAADAGIAEKGRILFQMQILANDICDENRMNYEIRLAEVRLLTADDFSSWASRYFGDSEAFSDPDQIIMNSTASGPEPAEWIQQDLRVYEELLDLYQTRMDSGDDQFVIFEWGSEPDDEPEQTAEKQVFQLLWDYFDKSDAATAAAVSERIDSLDSLLFWLESLGPLGEQTAVLESAVLNPDESLGQQYLKDYLSGRHLLTTEAGDLHGVIYSDLLYREEFKTKLAVILSDEIYSAPALSAYGFEKSRAELIDTFSKFGIIDSDKAGFITPGAVWDAGGFSAVSDVTDFYTEIDTAAANLILPEYLAGILGDYIGKLKDYFAVRAAAAFPTEFSGDSGSVNEKIRIAADLAGSLSTAAVTIRGSSDQTVKLLNLAVSDVVPAAVQREAERRLIETAAFDLAAVALDSEDVGSAEIEWHVLFDDYISVAETGLCLADGIESFRSMILTRAAELYDLSLALTDHTTAVADGASAEQLEIYRAMVWNILDFDRALENFYEDSDDEISIIEAVYLIESLMPEHPDAFPADVELDWLYGGNEVLREVDAMIVSGQPEVWAGGMFDIEEAVAGRYFRDEELSLIENRLTLSADEAAEGITLFDKSVQLWSDEFRGLLAGQNFGGVLKAFGGLVLINNAVEAAGEYTRKYGFREFLTDLLDGISLDEDDLVLLKGAAENPGEAVQSRLDKLSEIEAEALSGEDLFWNLVWNLRKAAGLASYSRTGARDAYIFDDTKTALIIENWISGMSNDDFDSYSEELDVCFESGWAEISALSGTAPGGIYSTITAFGLGGVLVENYNYSPAVAVDFVNWYMTKKEAGLSISAESLLSYLAVEPGQRLYLLLTDYPDAASHYLKKKISDRAFTEESLAEAIGMVGLPEETASELVEIQGIIDDITVYNPLLHGGFEDYLDERFGGMEQKQTARELYMRFTGSSEVQWDDPVFMPASKSAADARDLLKQLSFNRTGSGNTSPNEVFFNAALSEVYKALYEGKDSAEAELARLRAERDLFTRATVYVSSAETPDGDNWRSFLNEDYLSSDKDDLNLIPGAAVDISSADYARNLVITGSGEPAIQRFDSLTLFSGTGDDRQNIILDASNSYLDHAAYLSAAIRSWTYVPVAVTGAMKELSSGLDMEDGDEFWSSLDSKTYSEIVQAYKYEPSASTESMYIDARAGFYSRLAKIDSIRNSLSDLGSRRAGLLRITAAGDSGQLAELSPMKEEISRLEADIDIAQSEWQQIIDGDGGYRNLEKEYTETYELAKVFAFELDKLKLEYSTARAVNEYASAGYLIADQGGTGPAQKLAYINDKLVRAEAANDALEAIAEGRTDAESIYSGDEVYRSLFTDYLKTFRESLVLNRINLVLNKSIAEQEKVTLGALENWQAALDESYNASQIIAAEDDEAIVPSGLEDCRLSRNTDGTWGINWDGTASNAETFRQYFKANENSESGMSDFQNDLMQWLEKASGMMEKGEAQSSFTTWAMALKYEEFRDAGAPDNLSDEFWTNQNYFYRNGEADLDREGARDMLLSEWKNANDSVGAFTGEKEWMYNFYKLLEKSGIMKLKTASTAGTSFETFETLGRNESLEIVSRYIADQYSEDAKSYYIASVPLFTMAAIYFAAATAALAIPFNWIAALVLFACGTAAALSGSYMVGEGFAKEQSAADINNNIIKPAEKDNLLFISGFGRITDSIFEKKQLYEEEYGKLMKMKGEADEAVSADEQQVDFLVTAVTEGFEKSDEDLHGLLVQGGLSVDAGDAADDTAVLKRLFMSYLATMNQNGKDDCISSSLLLNALQQEAREYNEKTLRDLNYYLTGQDGIADLQAESESAFRLAYDQYLSEEISFEEYEAAAQTAYADPVFSVREHMLRLYENQAEIAGIILGSDNFDSGTGAALLKTQQTLLTGSGNLKGLYDYRMDNLREIKMYELQMMRTEMAEKFNDWESQMRAVSARGELEWKAAERNLSGKFSEWQKDIQRLYNRQAETWNNKYLDFLSDKQAWFDAVAIQSGKEGDMSVFENFGEITGASIAAAGADVLVPELMIQNKDPETLLSDAAGFELLGPLLDAALHLNVSIADTEKIFFTAASPSALSTADSLQSIKDFQSACNGELEKHLAQFELERMVVKIEEAEENFNEIIDDANQNLEISLNRTMRNDGYTRSGSRYEKPLVVGATLEGYVYEEGYVSTYDDYIPENIDFGTELKDLKGKAENMDLTGLQGVLARAMENIQEQLTRIFGYDDKNENLKLLSNIGSPVAVQEENGSIKYITDRQDISLHEKPGVIEGIINWLSDDLLKLPEDPEKAEARLKAETEEAEKRFAEISPGLFGIHVGYAPLFADNADVGKAWNAEGQIKYNGLGELGRIMGEFMFNKMKEGSGWAEVNMPHYKKPLWEGEFLGIEAPSMADLTSLAVTLCTAGAAGGINAFISAGLNLADDFSLAVMDTVVGDKDIVESGFDFIKTASMSMAGVWLGSTVSDAAVQIGDDLYGQILLGTGKTVAGNITNSAINAASMKLDDNGKIIFDYDLNALEQGIFGEKAIAGYIGAAESALYGQALNSLVAGSMTPLQQKFYGSFADLGSIAAGQAAGFGVHLGYQLAEDGFNNIGGSMTAAFDDMGLNLNVLDAGALIDFTGLVGAGISKHPENEFYNKIGAVADNLRGTGLLSMNITSSGVSSRLTAGGINIGGSIYSLGKGFTADMALKAYRAGENMGAKVLEKGFLHGDQVFENTIWRILFGKDDLIFDADGGETQTISKTGGGRAIHMSSAYAEVKDKELYKAVAVLQHESYRDGVIDLQNDNETSRAVKAHTEIALSLGRAYGFGFIAGDDNLLADVAAYIAAKGSDGLDSAAFADYVDNTYDSSADYWKLVENADGSLTLYDDIRGGVFYTDENGEEHEIGHYTGGSRTEHLQKILGLDLSEGERSRLNYELLVGLGSAETFSDGHFLDSEGRQISINLSGEWADRMGAALDYDRMFVDAWRTEGSMDMLTQQLRYIEKYGAAYTDREKYLADMYDKSVDFARRFNEGTATEFLFSQTEIENAVGFGENALCYATVPVNLYQLEDPSISLDMVADALVNAKQNNILLQDGTIQEYGSYLKLLGIKFDSTHYLSPGSDYFNLGDYLKSDYSMSDYAVYGAGGSEHHMLFRNNYELIDPYTYQLSWQDFENYRFRGLEWVDFK